MMKILCLLLAIESRMTFPMLRKHLLLSYECGNKRARYPHVESEKKIEKSIKWFGKAAAQENSCALGALYYYHIQESKRLSGLMILHNYK